MAIQPIRFFGDPVLTTPTSEVIDFDKEFANRGYTTTAIEILTRFGFDQLGLHRIEINIRPENAPSRRVAEKAGYHLEGTRARYLHIDGQWRDHVSYVKENPTVE